VKIAAITIVLLAILGVAAYATAEAWRGVGLTMTLHGWIALALGVVISIALGVGLMALTFYSARRGYDDRVDGDASAPSERTRILPKR